MKNEKGFAQAKEVWDERFRREGFLFGEEPNQYLVSQAATLTKRRALLVADGEGRNSVWLAKQGFDVDAFDISSEATEKSRDFAAKSGVQVNYYCCEYRDFDWREYTTIPLLAYFFSSPHLLCAATFSCEYRNALNPGVLYLFRATPPSSWTTRRAGPESSTIFTWNQPLKKAFRDTIG